MYLKASKDSASTGKYFAADEADKTVETLQRKAQEWFNNVLENEYLEKVRMSVQSYHGMYYSTGHRTTYGGEQGELVNLPVNHYANIATHIKNMIVANRPVFQARATNTDSKSEIQTELANGLLEYYMREKDLEEYLINAVIYAIVMGSGYIKMEWNSTSGEIYDYLPTVDDPRGEPIYEGDVEFRNMSPFDVVFDSSKETSKEHDWVLCRTFKNKYALAAKYPEYKDEIEALKTKSDEQRHTIGLNYFYEHTDDVAVYEFYHKRNEALPDGRYVLYLASDIILEDTALIYRDLPVYRIAPSNFLGTPYGYTPMFDLLPLQENINSLYSTIMTNQNAFGVQNILNPRGNDVRLNAIEGGLNFIEYTPVQNAPNGGAPMPLNLTQTPAEVFNFLQMLERQMETISGVNSVARGNPEQSLKSGTALALVQSQALQFMSGLQQSYVKLVENVGTGLINLLRDFAKVPRIAAIVGIDNRSKLKQFSGDDLDTVNRVIVDLGNPLATSTAGRVAMADHMLQMKIIDTPEKYLQVINSGKLEHMTGKTTDELILIKAENEALLSGESPLMAVFTDRHSLHVKEHRAVIADPQLRLTNPELIERTAAHIQEHLDLLRTVDPNTLALFGEQPLGPATGTPVTQTTVASDQPNQTGGAPIPPNTQAAGAGAGVLQPTLPGKSPNARLPEPAEAPETAPDGSPLRPQDIVPGN
jgi:hypothetical protein